LSRGFVLLGRGPLRNYTFRIAMASLDFTTLFSLGASAEAHASHTQEKSGSKRRVRRVQLELTELQDLLQKKTEELQAATQESLRLRQKLKAGADGAHTGFCLPLLANDQ
jgi:hypothetical protein